LAFAYRQARKNLLTKSECKSFDAPNEIMVLPVWGENLTCVDLVPNPSNVSIDLICILIINNVLTIKGQQCRSQVLLITVLPLYLMASIAISHLLKADEVLFG
jgi:hypothetical protein